ncbi:MAG: response regulator [candidate division NC10 bacterium]|nr:response regulator [candidate division NC10 bacterium]MDE2320650.1 response regulator [candidate division NC10 bacterium]
MTQAVILIVEDNPLGRELAKEILDAAGYTVLSAEDGVGLLERVTRERPDLILMDLQLPDIDGFSLIRDLKAHDETRQIPVVVTTAYSHPEAQAKAIETGCAAYLTKPLDSHVLLRTVADVLAR